ncbi:MAG: ATP-binding protein [Gammaproteobacteria bacterium]
MQVNRPQSLRRLLLTHETAFVLLVVISGALGATWAWLWQQWSEESLRLNYLAHTAQDIRSGLFKQIQEVSVAGLRGDAGVRELNSGYLRSGQELFNELRRKSSHRGEDYAVQRMQTAYSLLQASLRKTLGDPLALNRLVRSKLLDPTFEQNFVADFESAFEALLGLIDMQLAAQEKSIQRWTDVAPYGLGVPILVGIALLLFSRRSLARGFVRPMQSIMIGTREISGGNFGATLPEAGVAEVRELASGINTMAAELEASREALRTTERQAAQGALVPVVAHNIRNPLAAIRANAQLLDGSESVEEIGEIRAAILDTVDRLERWVSALVSYLHPLEPRRVPVAATAVLEAALSLLEGRLEEAGVSCRRGQWDAAGVIDADPDLLEQALYGLLNNAVEASARGAVIEVAVIGADGAVRIEIRDQAGGIPFQPEPSELEPGPTTKRFGTGLGIPVAYKICGVHGYKLEFVIDPGKGTRVLIVAPAAESVDGA